MVIIQISKTLPVLYDGKIRVSQQGGKDVRINRIDISLIVLIIFVLILSSTVAYILFFSEEEENNKTISNNYVTYSEILYPEDKVNFLNKRIHVKGFLGMKPGRASMGNSPYYLMANVFENGGPIFIDLYNPNFPSDTNYSTPFMYQRGFEPFFQKEVIVDGIVKNATFFQNGIDGETYQYYYLEVLDIILKTDETSQTKINLDEISIDNSKPVVEKDIVFSIKLINIRNTILNNFNITLSLNNSMNTIVIGTTHLDSLAPDETKTIKFSWKAKKGEYLPYVSVDGDVNLVDGESQNSFVVVQGERSQDSIIPIILISTISILLVIIIFLLLKRKKSGK